MAGEIREQGSRSVYDRHVPVEVVGESGGLVLAEHTVRLWCYSAALLGGEGMIEDQQLRDELFTLEVKHPPELWAGLIGIHILDFDGFREEGSWVTPLTRHEFMEAARQCTVDGDTHRILAEYFDGGGRSVATYKVSTREKMPVLAAPEWLVKRMAKLRAMTPDERRAQILRQ